MKSIYHGSPSGSSEDFAALALKYSGAYWLRRVIDVRGSMPSFVRELVKKWSTKNATDKVATFDYNQVNLQTRGNGYASVAYAA